MGQRNVRGLVSKTLYQVAGSRHTRVGPYHMRVSRRTHSQCDCTSSVFTRRALDSKLQPPGGYPQEKQNIPANLSDLGDGRSCVSLPDTHMSQRQSFHRGNVGSSVGQAWCPIVAHTCQEIQEKFNSVGPTRQCASATAQQLFSSVHVQPNDTHVCTHMCQPCRAALNVWHRELHE